MVALIGKFLRLLPDFKGKRMLARFILGKNIKKYSDFSVVGRYGCEYRVPNLEEIIGFELYVNGIFEKEIVSFLISKMQADAVFLDLGANIGAVSLPICRNFPGAKVYCVEASPFVMNYLESNLAINKINNCKVFDAVLSDRSGEKINFYFPDKQFGKGAVTNLFNSQSKQIDSITIDELIEKENISRVDLIKMDIEGYEYFAFKGGMKLFQSDDAPPVLFEFVDYAESSVPGLKSGSAQSLLMQFGYDLFLLKEGKLFPMEKPVIEGFAMIWAVKSKKKINAG